MAQALDSTTGHSLLKESMDYFLEAQDFEPTNALIINYQYE